MERMQGHYAVYFNKVYSIKSLPPCTKNSCKNKAIYAIHQWRESLNRHVKTFYCKSCVKQPIEHLGITTVYNASGGTRNEKEQKPAA